MSLFCTLCKYSLCRIEKYVNKVNNFSKNIHKWIWLEMQGNKHQRQKHSPVVILTETGGPSLFRTRAKTFTSYCAPSSNCLRSTDVTLPPTSWLCSSPPTITLTILIFFHDRSFSFDIYSLYILWAVTPGVHKPSPKPFCILIKTFVIINKSLI